jgi:hypothetical protein
MPYTQSNPLTLSIFDLTGGGSAAKKFYKKVNELKKLGSVGTEFHKVKGFKVWQIKLFKKQSVFQI